MDIFNVTLKKALFLLQVSGKKTKSLRSLSNNLGDTSNTFVYIL